MYRDDKIRGRMAEMKLSVEEVAARAEVAPNTVSAMRNGKEVRPSKMEAVCKVLGLTMQELFEPRPEPAAAQQR